MSQPLVSVITPCYNARSRLEQVLTSVRDSTYPAIEHIIIDDASTDGSLEVLEALADRYEFVSLSSTPRQGPAPARNRGVQSSKGKYLLFLDCDDTIEPSFIETLVAAAETSPENVAPFYTPIQLHGAMERAIGGASWSLERLVDSPFINVCSLVPRAAFDRVGGFNPKLRVLEDYELFLKLAFAGYRGQLVPDVRLHCYIGSESYSDHFNQRGGDTVKRRTRGAILQAYRSRLEQLGLADRPKVAPYLDGREGDVGAFDLSRVAEPSPKAQIEAPPAVESPRPAEAQPAAEDNEEPGLNYPEDIVLVEAKYAAAIEPIADMLLGLIPGKARRVLEVGCGADALGAQFKRVAPHCEDYIGIALDEAAAKDATDRVDTCHICDLDALASPDKPAIEIPPASLDCIVYRQPVAESTRLAAIVANQTDWLKPEGIVLFAQPNPHYWQEIAAFLSGRRSPQGHTISEVRQILQNAGLTMLDVRPLDSSAEAPSEAFRNWLYEGLDAAAAKFGFDRGVFEANCGTSHYIFRAWKADAMPHLLLVQTLLISTMASDRVRIYQPDRLLQGIPGARTVSNLHALALVNGRPNEEKVFIWQRARLKREDGIARQRRILNGGYLIVAEIDDDPRFWPDHIEADFFTFRACHCIQTSTEPLAEFLRQFNPHVKIIPNQLPELPPPREYDDRAPVKIFFGALNREPDWQPLMMGLNRTLADLGDRVRVQVVHDRHFYHALQTPHKSFVSTCTYDRYHEILRECDIALLPLNPTEFNSMKSDLKFIECAGRGVVVLASPTVYARSVKHGKTGLLFHTPEEFEVLLHQVVENHEWRRGIAANAYAYVRDERLISHHYRERYDWYLEMRDRLPELNESLRERVPEIFAES